MIDWSAYPNFTEAEMRCKCGCGQADMKPDFMMTLQRVRNALGRSMIVTSGFRCSEYDKRIGGAGVHPTGLAADIWISGKPAYDMLGVAYAMEVRGIGLKQHGPHANRFIHLDTVSDHTRPRVWTYT